MRLVPPAGRYGELRLELPNSGVRGSFVKIQPEPISGPDAADPAISDSGLDFVRFPLPASSAPVVLHVTVLTNSRADTAPLQATLSYTLCDPSGPILDDATALAAFNHAERLRRSHAGGDKALPAYQDALRAARQAADPVLEQQVLLSAGRMLMLDGQHYAEAVAWERQAVALTGPGLSPSVQALAWKMLGGALLDTDRYAESLDASAHARQLYEQTGQTFWQGVVLENMGEAQLNLGQLPQALATDQRALAISRTLHDDFGTVEMLAAIGSVQRTLGQYQAALDDFSDAVEVTLPSTYNPMQGEAWLAMGELHRDLAEPQRAAADFARALEIAQHTSSGLDELQALEHIATLRLESGDLAQAEAGFTQALARARELKLLRLQPALLIGLARTAIAQKAPEKAEPLLRQAIDLAGSIHQDAASAEAWLTLGRLAEAASRTDDARADFAKAAGLCAAIPDKAGLAQADASLARVEAAADFPAALAHLTQALDIVESSRTSFARGELRTRFFAAQRATYDQAIALLMDQDRRSPNAGFAAQAWRIAERARARSLLDELWSAQSASDATTAAPEFRQRLAALEVRIAALEEQQTQAGTGPGDLDALTKIQADLRNTVLAADELESRIRSGESGAAMPAAPLTPAAFAASALSPGDALVEYWVSSGGSFAWLILSDGRCSGFRLPASAVLLDRTSAWRDALLARNVSPASETLHGRDARIAAADLKAAQLSLSLASTLIPAEMQAQLAGVKRLVVIADGPLAQLPFAGLRLADPAAHREAYLIERFELIHEPSAAYLTLPQVPHPREAGVNGNATAFEPLRVAVFADPVYNLADSRLAARPIRPKPVALTRAAPAADLTHLPRLPGSRQEALAIASIAGPERSSVFLGFAATPAAVHSIDWDRYPIAHFAVHAVSQAGSAMAAPDSAGLLLSLLDRDGSRQDGILWVREIYTARMAHDLVVLSGCGTALGESVPGEGMNSLARAFLFSGTRQVAATLWSADDTTASTLMEQFYRQLLLHGKSASQALRTAQLDLIESRRAPPLYWAGFVVEGQWKTH